jgi:hypothetical protein
MTQIVLDAAAAGKLHTAVGPVELLDPSGKVLGRFIPLVDLNEWEPVGPEATEEELDERERSTDWYTTDQVLEHLRRLESQ